MYPRELRERVVEAYLAGEGSSNEIGERFYVSGHFVQNMVTLYRKTGGVEPKPHRGGQLKLGTAGEKALLKLVEKQPDATLNELRLRVGRMRHVSMTVSGVHRALARLGVTYKKSLRAAEQDRPDVVQRRLTFQKRRRRLGPKRFVSVDEFGLNLTMTRTYARAPRGHRAEAKAPANPGKNITLVFGLRLGSVVTPTLFEGGMNGAVCEDYVLKTLAPCLRAKDIVVYDNLGAHRGEVAKEAIRRKAASVQQLPLYSPDYSPIESAGSKVKTTMRAAEARTLPNLATAATQALGAITPRDIRGWFRHCGFCSEYKFHPP